MAFTVTCPCGKRLRAKASQAGKKSRCPACGQSLQVPEPDDCSSDEPLCLTEKPSRGNYWQTVALLALSGVLYVLSFLPPALVGHHQRRSGRNSWFHYEPERWTGFDLFLFVPQDIGVGLVLVWLANPLYWIALGCAAWGLSRRVLLWVALGFSVPSASLGLFAANIILWTTTVQGCDNGAQYTKQVTTYSLHVGYFAWLGGLLCLLTAIILRLVSLMRAEQPTAVGKPVQPAA